MLGRIVKWLSCLIMKWLNDTLIGTRFLDLSRISNNCDKGKSKLANLKNDKMVKQ